MSRRFRLRLALGLVACVALVGFFFVASMLTSENWCEDRSPWWGPPTDPASTCSGHAWARQHPDDYPWNLPR